MVRRGHLLTHALVREHQQRALEEVCARGGTWRRLFNSAAGLHALLYGPIPLFGSETWQFTLRPGGGLRITLPEIVGLGRDALGRAGWLDPLIAAWARQDNVGARQQMDRLLPLLALLGATPDALLM